MAVITVSPTTDISALIASNSVSPGDVLVLEDGEYFQTVNVTKDYLRFVAKGTKAVFNGKSILQSAFILNDVTGVEVNGMSIMHYRGHSILIEQGSGNRIIGNKINRVLNTGIRLFSTRENLVWKNEICNAFDGIQLILNCINNHIIENLATLCEDDGFECFGLTEDNNVLIGNIAINNGGFGVVNFGDNVLLVDNVLVGNRLGGISISINVNSVMLGNIIRNNPRNGCFMRELTNLFFAENKVEANRLEGVAYLEDSFFGAFHHNIIKHNINTGITLDSSTQSNLLINNKWRCNIPVNVVDAGVNNNFIGNVDEPCKPGELPFEDCDICLKG